MCMCVCDTRFFASLRLHAERKQRKWGATMHSHLNQTLNYIGVCACPCHSLCSNERDGDIFDRCIINICMFIAVFHAIAC